MSFSPKSAVGRFLRSQKTVKQILEVGLSPQKGGRIVFIERPGCHLCEEALSIVETVASEFEERVERKNLERDEELAKRWSLEIPVIAVDGKVISVYRADTQALRKALRRS